MEKVMRCRDVGMDCDFQAKGQTDEEILQKAAEHARKDHGINEISPDLAAKVKSCIHEE